MRKKLFFNLMLFIFLLAMGWIPIQAQTEAASSAEPVEYVVEAISGTQVQVKEADSNAWDRAQEGQVLESGDEIRVGEDSQATLTMQSDTQVHLYAQSDLKVAQIEPNPTHGFLSRLIVFTGVVLSDVKKNLLESHSSFEVDANGVVCSVRGTAFEVSNLNGQVVTATHEGNVQTVQDGQTHFAQAGMAVSYRGGRFLGMRRLTMTERNRFKKWRSLRGRIRMMRLRRLRAIRSGRRRSWSRHRGQGARALRRRRSNRYNN